MSKSNVGSLISLRRESASTNSNSKEDSTQHLRHVAEYAASSAEV